MEVAVVGGTGTLGALVVDELVARRNPVRVLTRNAPAHLADGATHHRIDLTTGEGLDDALAGVDVVVDASSAKRAVTEVLVDGTRRLLAAEKRAGVGHHLVISIVGIDDVSVPYYKAKVAQEQAVMAGGVPWSILRATQFHSFVADPLERAARLRISLRSRSRVQPVDPSVVASVVADALEAGPGGRLLDVAGPETHTLTELARMYGDRRGRVMLPVPLPLPPRIGRPLRDGALTNPAAADGGATFDQWLAARV